MTILLLKLSLTSSAERHDVFHASPSTPNSSATLHCSSGRPSAQSAHNLGYPGDPFKNTPHHSHIHPSITASAYSPIFIPFLPSNQQQKPIFRIFRRKITG